MNQEEESFGPIVVGVEEISLDEADVISPADAKQILINTFESAGAWLDDESTYTNGWRIRLANESVDRDLEEKIDVLLSIVSNGTTDIFTIASAAADRTGAKHEQGKYTNLSYYFFSEADAEKHRLEILASIHHLQVKEEGE